MTADPIAPTATYRLQLQPGFPFEAARRAVPYLASLGVSHLHLSPVLEARPGSTHGYDVVDHSAVRAELGGERGLRSLARTARAHGLGLIVDIVPNHMAAPVPERLNRPLWEVLREGPASPYARWFDIDWAEHGGKVLLPVLGGPLGEELKRLAVEGEGDDAVLRYHDHTVPLRPGTAGLPLPELLDAQWYRLGWWRLARTELNYRRFFTISELIAVRAEDPEVFAATHAKLLELVRDGVIDGLRVDHPDGLADPAGYLRRLDREVRAATADTTVGGGRWTVVEKILARNERLPADWPVAGTTGYDALHHIDGLFLDPDGPAALAMIYQDLTAAGADEGGDWAATVRRAAREVVTHELAAEVARLVRTASRICDASPRLRDHAPWALRTAVRELLVRLPVYRPYAVVGTPAPDGDAALLEEAARGARTAFAVAEEARAVDTVRDAALGRLGDGPHHRDFCARFAQTAAALRAKSVEDTAFYRHTPLLSAAEVGGDPGRPAVPAEEFHAFAARLLRDWPATGTVLSTHDTKRSADVRARIAALTQSPEWWGRLMAGLLAKARAAGERDGTAAPDAPVVWTAWQTALGLGHADTARLVPAVLKGVRESGLRTTWTERDPAYEEAVAAYLESAEGPGDPAAPVWAEIAAELDAPARVIALGAALVQLTMPGVPDLYMGTEHLYRALVDPDNRRPPEPRPEALVALDAGREADGVSAEKLLLTSAALRLRREHPEWFGAGSGYVPLRAEGPAAAHCVAFARVPGAAAGGGSGEGAGSREGNGGREGSGSREGGGAVTVVTRLSRRLAAAGGWGTTRLPLPPGRWRDLLTGRRVEGACPLGELLARLPVALLMRE
ncbi:malto-oligosyltrehalose synthase [Streptomyces sp. NA02950]|uniref:malto-oligosyltrehalose synthase n=1 Tax=Streptomyces sp. NA02950 TaxID=2742137 RepID=UPI00158FBC16|nr:malto-oligosyltrehalose synthase [Streptomyces sp. NA02950]QKV92014.1 malto-oligosyltrehalose synthase [Streptomyces sp. NA02950]